MHELIIITLIHLKIVFSLIILYHILMAFLCLTFAMVEPFLITVGIYVNAGMISEVSIALLILPFEKMVMEEFDQKLTFMFWVIADLFYIQ